MTRLAGKVAIVTGAAQGIGRSVALRAAAEGGNVLFVDRADFVGDVASEAGARGRSFVCDLEAYEGATRAMAEAVRCFGGVLSAFRSARWKRSSMPGSSAIVGSFGSFPLIN